MAPSLPGDGVDRNERTAADKEHSEAQAPRHTANTASTAGANFPIPRPPDPNAHTHGFLPRYPSTAAPPFQLIVPPTAPSHQAQNYGFNNLAPWHTQQTALAGAVQPPQLQTSRMHQAPWAPSSAFYGTPGRQHFNGSSQVPYGTIGSPYTYGSPQLSYPVQQVSQSGQQFNAAFQANPTGPHDLRGYRPPSTNMLQSPHGQLQFRPPPAQVSPPIQEWPTSNLSNMFANKQGRGPEGKGRAQQPADEHSTQVVLPQRGNIQPASSSAPSISGKRKASAGDSQLPPTLPPHLRQPTQSLHPSPACLPGDSTQYHSQYSHPEMSDPFSVLYTVKTSPHYTPPPHIPSYISTRNQYEQNGLHSSSSSYGHYAGMYGSSHHQHASGPLPFLPLQHRGLQSSAEPLPAKPVRREDIHQPIGSAYENYKWPVKLYELRPNTGFDFVHLYMEDWFEKNILSSGYKWHCHTTEGFIEGGNRFSIVVLHNAADPFTWNAPSQSTTSFAVYGRFARRHNELRWTTITPSIPGLIESNADFALKNRWDFDMPKATERRFHRAYFLAARMAPLGRLLNQHRIDGEPHDEPVPGEMDEDITFTEEDLQSQWIDGPMSAEHAEGVWMKIVDEVEGRPMDGLGGEHMTIGCSERAWEDERYG